MSALSLAPLFQNHAVFQRDQPIPVWGTGRAGERISVDFAGCETTTRCGDNGTWELRLPAMPAGGPFVLVAQCEAETVVLNDLLVGEVWLCSGQSNMELTLANSNLENSSEAETAMPDIRMITVASPASITPTVGVHGAWRTGSLDTFMAFSAVGGWFARCLNRELGVPIGIICNAWGGTRIQAWVSRNSLVKDACGLEETRAFEAGVWLKRSDSFKGFLTYSEWELNHAPKDLGNRGLSLGWADAAFDDSRWPEATVPAHWSPPDQPQNGIIWFRRTVQIPRAWEGHDVVLHLGAIDKHDDTYVNSGHVGGLSWESANAWCTPRVYSVPARLVSEGRLVIAVRARSHVYDGGLIGPASSMRLVSAAEAGREIPLAGKWRFCVEQNWGTVVPPATDWGANSPHSPSILFRSRVAPVVPYGLRGVLWYQGESNVHEAAIYARLLRLLIQDWRQAWGQERLSFGLVQLANFHSSFEVPLESRWAELREAQFHALAEPDTGLVVTIDIGEAHDIHPRNKKDVGLRLARWALSEVYQRGGVYCGPVVTRCEREVDGRIRCHFRNVGGGLVAKGAASLPFAVAGEGGRYVNAPAIIDGESVVLSSSLISRPVSVRYAWADNPGDCILCNQEGYPAVPFGVAISGTQGNGPLAKAG